MSYPEQITVSEIHAKREQNHMGKAEFDRDMSRLKDLRQKYGNPGLNTYESNEVEELLEKYEIEYNQWTMQSMFL